jgi:hypothetical protein
MTVRKEKISIQASHLGATKLSTWFRFEVLHVFHPEYGHIYPDGIIEQQRKKGFDREEDKIRKDHRS